MGFVVPIILEVRKRGRGNVSRDEARSTKQFGKSGLTHVAGIYTFLCLYIYLYVHLLFPSVKRIFRAGAPQPFSHQSPRHKVQIPARSTVMQKIKFVFVMFLRARTLLSSIN